MSKKYDFDYIVIGSGPAGSNAAITLSKAKKRVAIVENRFLGGTNLNAIDVPYAVALDFSHSFHKLSSLPEFRSQELTFNHPSVINRELKTIVNISKNEHKTYEESGVVCLNGFANFIDQHTIAIGTKTITGSHFIIATGSHLKTTEISGTDTFTYLTPESAPRIRRTPEVIAVVGAGSTGCEIASYYAELGTKAILLEMAPRILPREDNEVSEVTLDYFTKNLHMTVLNSSKVVAIGEDKDSKYVIFQYGTTEKMVRVEHIILATGYTPNINFGLENAGVKYKNSGITVNKYFETSAKNIYAIGDCLGGNDSTTERAYQQGITLATNIINHSKTIPNYLGIPRITNLAMEIATVGYNEEDLLRRDRKFKKTVIKFSDITAGSIYNTPNGFVKLLADRNNYIIGATIVSPHAHLLIQEIALAIRHHIAAIELASTPHAINSYNYAVKLAARNLVSKK